MLAAVLLLLMAACGSGNGEMGGMMQSGATGAGSGARALFVTDCGSCHKLAAAGTSGTAGPNLDQARPSYGEIVDVVTHGGSVMPAYAGRLSRSQIEAVARYVSGATG